MDSTQVLDGVRTTTLPWVTVKYCRIDLVHHQAPHSAACRGALDRWLPDEEPPGVKAAFPELARRAWKCLRAATHPHLVKVLTGKPVSQPRIGPAAKLWIHHDTNRSLLGITIWYQLTRQPSAPSAACS